jgi:hypothetical protein
MFVVVWCYNELLYAITSVSNSNINNQNNLFKKCLKIPKYLEAVYRQTYIIMVKRKRPKKKTNNDLENTTQKTKAWASSCRKTHVNTCFILG